MSMGLFRLQDPWGKGIASKKIGLHWGQIQARVDVQSNV